jgi:hypothetical protein
MLELEITDMLHIFWDVTWRIEDIYCFGGTYWLCVHGRISRIGKKVPECRARGKRSRE